MNRNVYRAALLSLTCALLIVSFPAQAAAPVHIAKGTIVSVQTYNNGLAQVKMQTAAGELVLFNNPSTRITIDGKPSTSEQLQVAASKGKLTAIVTYVSLTGNEGTALSIGAFSLKP